MYYQRTDVREAILNFANPGVWGVRECAIYNQRFKSIQRYVGENGSKEPISLSASNFDGILEVGASAFYSSYWLYEGVDFTHPIGRDLVWTIRARHGGLFMAKLVAKLVVDALQEEQIEPRVKYSGDLGFDVIIPLESIPYEAWMGNLRALDELHQELTIHIIGHIREHFPEAEVDERQSSATIRVGSDVCLLSELRVRRGLLLAPMSLNPETNLVSVPVDPARLESFSAREATPGSVRSCRWTPPTLAYSLLRFAHHRFTIEAEPAPTPA